MIFRLAREDEVQILTDISKRSFDTDITVGGTEPGGPPEYDSYEWHMQMLREGS